MAKNNNSTNCESCAFYDYDDEYGNYICEANLDEDEMYRFMQGNYKNCPYYRYYDEYKIVRKQN